jgi:hypothetical protein
LTVEIIRDFFEWQKSFTFFHIYPTLSKNNQFLLSSFKKQLISTQPYQKITYLYPNPFKKQPTPNQSLQINPYHKSRLFLVRVPTPSQLLTLTQYPHF